MDNIFSRLFTRKTRKQGARQAKKTPRQPMRKALRLELLEDRLAPAVITYVWTNGDNNGSWADNANWTNGGPASLGAGNTAILQFNASTAAATGPMTDNLTNPYSVNEIHFDADASTSAGYTINGTNTINLNAAAGIVVDSGFGVAASTPVTFGSGITFALTAASAITNNDANTVVTIGGAVNLTTGGVGHTLTVVGGLDVTVNGVISGSGTPSFGASSSLVLNSGSLTLNGTNTYTNPIAVTPTGTTVNGGTLFVGNSSGLGAAANTETVTGGGEIVLFNGASPTMTGTLTLNNGGLFGFDTNTWTGPITLMSADAIATLNGGTLVINGAIGSTGTPSLAINGRGVTEFQQNNTYSGVTTVDAGNVLQIDAPGGLGAGGAGNGTTVNSGGELLLNFTSGNPLAASAGTGAAENLTLAGTGVNALGALQVLGAASPTVNGTIALTGNTTIGVGTGTLTLGATAVISGAGDSLTYDEDVTTAGSVGAIITSAANTYTGSTTVGNPLASPVANQTGVTLEVENSASFGATAGATVTVESGSSVQLKGGIIIPQNFAFLGTGSGGAVPFSTANGATASLNNVSGTNTITGNISLPNPTTSQLTVSVDAPADTLILSGAISGVGGAGTGGGLLINAPLLSPAFVQSTGKLQFAGASPNTYGGLTSVDDGELDLNKTSGVVAVPGSLTIGDTVPDSVAHGPVVPNSDIVKLLAANQFGFPTNAVLTINPDGELLLNGFNATIPTLTMTAGTIDEGGAVLTLTGDVTATGFLDPVAPHAARQAIIENGTVALNVPFAGAPRTFTVNDSGNIGATHYNFNDLALDSVVTDGVGAPRADLVKTGGGLMRLGNDNTYTGRTLIEQGLLFAQDNGSLGFADGTATSGTEVFAGASLLGVGGTTITGELLTLDGPGFPGVGTAPAEESLTAIFGGANFTWAGNIVLNTSAAAPATLGADTFYSAAQTLEVSGVISGGTGLGIQGNGRVLFDGTAPNTYSGATTVAAGATLELDKVSGGTPQVAVPDNGLGAGVTNLDIFGKVQVDLGSFALNGFEIATSSTVTVESTGDLQIGDAVAQQTIAGLNGVAGGMVDLTTHATNNLNVTGAINISGAGTFHVNGAAGAAHQFSTNGNTVTVGTGSLLDLNVGIDGIGFTEVSADGTAGPTIQFSGTAQNFVINVAVNSGTLLLAKTGPLPAAGLSILPAGGPGNLLTIGSGASVPGSAVVRDTGSSWQLGGINSGGVNVSIQQDGVLDLNNHLDRVASLTMSGGTVSIGTGQLFVDGPFVFNPDTLGTTSVIQGAGAMLNLDNVTRSFTVNTGANALISATIPNGGVDKLGAGSLTLTGNNGYTGPTTVDAGTLFVNGSQGGSPVTVNSGGTLSGGGTVGPLTVNNGGTIAPLAVTGGPSLLTVQGGATLNSGAIFDAVLDSTTPGSGYSQLNASGNVVIQAGDTLNVTVNNAFPAGTTFTIIHGNTVTGTFTTLNVTPNTIPITQFDNGTALILTIQLSTTSTTVSGPGTAVFEQPVTLSSTVLFAAGTVSPTGTVQFFDNTGGGPVAIGTAQPVGPAYNAGTHSATVTITVPTLTSGVGGLNNVITATYSGDSINAGSTSTTPAVVDVSPAQTTETLSYLVNGSPAASPLSTVFEEPATVTAQISVNPPSQAGQPGEATVPTGNVTFTATNASLQVFNLGTIGLNGNLSASASLSSLPPGSYTISATYTSGNTAAFTAPASPSTGSDTVAQALTTTMLTAPTATNTVSFNQSITASATVTVNSPSTGAPTPPTGFVTFTATPAVGAPVSQTVGLNGNSATTTFNLPPGSYTITATYLGDTNFGGSGPTAPSPTQTVTTASTSVVLSSSANPAAPGTSVTFTTTVTNTSGAGTQPAPDGTVEMFDGATDIGPAHLVGSSGNATTFTFTTSTLSLASHAITAHYTSSSGDFANHVSNTVTEVIQPAVTAFILTNGGSVSQVTPSGIQSVPTNPGPGVVTGVSAVTDGTGHQVLYGIASGTGDLWQFSNGSWSEISTGLFAQVSAATNAQGEAVVFGVLGPNSLLPGTLWEQNPAAGSGLNAGWFEISSAPFLQVSAVGTPAGEVAYGILSPALGQPFGASLWRYDASQNPNHVVNAGWNQESSGQFAMVSAGRSGSQAIVFGILSSASALPGTLWSQNPAFGTEGLNSGWEQLSGSGPFPAQFSAVAAEANSTNGSWFGISGGQVFGHTSTINGELTPALPASAVQLSATHTPAGTDEVFATLVDGELWEFQAGVGASPAGWEQLLAGGVDATTAP